MYFRGHPGSWQAMFPTGSPSLMGSRLLRLLSLEATREGCIFKGSCPSFPLRVSQFVGMIDYSQDSLIVLQGMLSSLLIDLSSHLPLNSLFKKKFCWTQPTSS